jgi:hypothetical protein
MTAARRLLVVTTDPPPTSSGLGIFWAKLCMGAVGDGLAIDFLGPEPALCSPHGPSGLPERSILHGLGAPPLARKTSVERNRTQGLARAAWSAARAPFALTERFLSARPYEDWAHAQVQRRLSALLAAERYDAVAVLPPPLRIADTVLDVARSAGVPYVHVVGDPIGERGDGSFRAQGLELQAKLMDQAAAVWISRPTYERYYRAAFAPDEGKVVFLGDLFVPLGEVEERAAEVAVAENVLLHWGQVNSWRSVDALADALRGYDEAVERSGGEPLTLMVMGRITDTAMRKRTMAKLGERFAERPLLPYLDARAVARTARRMVVIVSPDHRDNVPSKLIDSLALKKPILLLAHPDSAAGDVMRRLGVGIVADVRSAEAILAGLFALEARRDDFTASYDGNTALDDWRCQTVGRRFRHDLRRVMGWETN